ncbi:MAG: ABC transporter permease [Marinisporobacter sp.]|jgi:ABC-2 type transport system permease protein|nr:ABC transporter permease [Marinisporobacter sp.]
MAQLLKIITYQIKQLLKNKKTIISTVAVPIILTMLFSGAAKGEQITTLYVIDDAHSRYSKDLLRIFHSDESMEIIESTRDQVNGMMKKQKSIMALVILKDFGKRVMANKGLALELIRNYDSAENMLAKHKITNKVSIYQDMLSDSQYAMTTLKKYKVVDRKDKLFHSTLNEIMNIWDEPSKHLYDSKPVAEEGEKMHWTTYTSIGFLVFFLWFAVIQGIRTFIEEKENKIYKRLLSTPVSYSKFIIGKLIAIFIYGGIQILVLVLAGKFIFHISWFENIISLSIVMTTYLFTVTCMGTLFVPFVKNQRQLNTITSLIIVISSMIGGAFFPLEIGPKVIQNIAKITPQRWTMMSIIDVISNNGTLTSQLKNIYVLVAMGFVALCIALIFINKQIRAERGV